MKKSSNEKSYTFDKHRKKKKRKHKKRRKSSTSSDCESSDGEVIWVEASASSRTKTEKKKKKHKKEKSSSSSSDSESTSHQIQQLESHCMSSTTNKREHWMNEETFVPTVSKEEFVPISTSRQKRIDSMREQRRKEEKIQQDKELNPHWKHTGTGLPEKDASIESLNLPSTSVGDGGYSWLKKAYYRIQEQAQRDGRSMEEVAIERWGSLKKLVSMIEEAEARMKSHPDHKERFHNLRDESNCYLQYSSAKQFKIPHDNENESNDFDTIFKFQKPDNKKPDKVINQFKSCRKPYSYDYSQSQELQNTRKEVSEQKVPAELQQLGIKSSSNKKDCIPAWKKPKYAGNQNKELLETRTEAHLTSKTINIIKNNIDSKEISAMYSEEDLNKLAACQMKAEILGNTALALTLKKQLEDARNITKEKGFAQQPAKSEEVIILTKVGSQGQVHPLQTTEEKISDYKYKKPNKRKYYDDGSKYSLKQMFEREKHTTADDQVEMFVEASAKYDDSTEIDFELGNVSKKLSQKLATGREEEKDIGKAIRQHQKLTAALEKCEYCLDQACIKKYLIVDIGEQIYLSLPNYQTITDGHCLIVPKTHISSFLSLDENEWREINLFKNELRNMFKKQKRSVIFLETSMNFRYHPHAILECIPIPEEEDSYAPMYFKKAIQESEAEWANNIKLVDLTKKSLRHSIPKNLPYFHVEFDPKIHAGFAHVIEDEQTFPRNFGKEVLGGMLDIDFNQLYKNKKEDPLKKSKEVVEFEKMWKKFKNEDF